MRKRRHTIFDTWRTQQAVLDEALLKPFGQELFRRILAIAPPQKWTKEQQAKFEVRMEDSGPAEIFIHGYIGNDYWDESSTSETQFRNALKGIPTDRELIVSINSEGGSVKEGLGIYDAIRRWPSKTTARIAGCAFSIASIIPLGADSVISPRSCFWMIHDPWSGTHGNAEDHRRSIDMLEACAETMAAIYSEATGKTRKEMRADMKAETWVTGEDAVKYGLADETNDDDVDIAAEHLIQNFHPPERLVAMMRAPRAKSKTTPSAPAAGHNIMQKDKIIQLLAKHGKSVAPDASDETILAALEEIRTSGKVTTEEAENLKKAPEQVIVSANEYDALRRQVTHERTTRLKQEFSMIAAERPFLTEEKWLPRILQDETVLNELRAVPRMGAKPLEGRPVIENLGSSMIESYRKLKAGKQRMEFSAKHWLSLRDAYKNADKDAFMALPAHEQIKRLYEPRAANTYSATLVTDRLADGVITTLGNRLASLRSFSRNFGTDRLKPRATVQVRKVTAGSTVQTNPTNFETGGSTTVPISVAVDQLSVSFSATNDELNKGHQVKQVADKNAQNFANKISDAWTAILLIADYNAQFSIGDSATFDGNDMPGILALAKNYGMKNLVLDGSYRAQLAPIDLFKFPLGAEGAFGFDLITEHNKWTGATANTVGIVCDPNAIAVCSGLPEQLPADEFLELQEFTIEGIDLTVLLCHWFSRASREHWMSFDVMFGAKAGDTTALRILSS